MDSEGTKSVKIKAGPGNQGDQVVRHSRRVVKEGWIYKRGAKIPTWRSRYFYLFDDGSLLGYTSKPVDFELAVRIQDSANNNFTVVNCEFMLSDQPKPFTLVLSGLHWDRKALRYFSFRTDEERRAWINAISLVSEMCKNKGLKSRAMGKVAEGAKALVPEPESVLSKLKLEKEISSEDDETYGSTVVFQIGGDDSCESSSSNGSRKIALDDLMFIRLLGKGTFGKVVLCREKATEQLFALKMIRKDDIVQNNEVDHIWSERRVMQVMKHPFIVSFLCSFTTKHYLCFVTEFVNGGELFFHLSREGKFSEERTRFYGAEITSALGYLHDRDIIHRDMKLENILLDKDGHVRLTDFGLCKENVGTGSYANTFCGTPEYIAPEVIEDDMYGKAVDWWGLGVALYEMVTGRPPFYCNDQQRLYEMIISHVPSYPSHLSEEVKDFLIGLLRKHPTQRLGGGPGDAQELKNHPFFASINWKDLDLKLIPPPFRPEISSEIDTRNFDPLFTNETVKLTPDSSFSEKCLGSMDPFLGFSYGNIPQLV